MTDPSADTDQDLPSDDPKVFLSYSRKDREQAQRIADALRGRDFGVFRDTDDILPTEEWRERLQQLIEEADTIVFLMSPHSIASEVCAWEVEYATALKKRIAPIVIDDVDGGAIPPLLSRLNFIFCTSRDPFENAVETLVSALSLDIEWIREHTRLSGLARRWQDAGRPKRLLLRGQDIADAEAWRDSRPPDAPDVNQGHIDLIGESRRASQARQRGWIAGSLVVALVTAGLSVFAWFQSVEADRQRDEAEVQRATAETERDRADAERQRAEVQRQQAEEQRDLAEQRLREALIERSRRSLTDADVLIRAGQHAVAAPMVRQALVTASSLDDPDLISAAERAARQMLWTDRLHGSLEVPAGYHGPLADSEQQLGITWARLASSPDGSFISHRRGDRVSVWSILTGHLSATSAQHVVATDWLSDNTAVIVRNVLDGSGDTLIDVLDPATGKILRQYRAPLNTSNSWLFPDQDMAVMSGQRRDQARMLVLRLSDGVQIFDIPTSDVPQRIAVSDDGRRMAAAFGDPDRLVIYNGSGTEVDRYAVDPDQLLYAPDEQTLAFRLDRNWWLWPADGGPEAVYSDGEPAELLQFLGQGRMVVRADSDNVSLIDRTEGEKRTTLPVGRVFGLAGTIDEGNRFLLRLDQQFAVHDSATGDLLHRIGRVSPPVGGAHLSRHGDYLAIIHQNGLVSVWSTETGREILSAQPDFQVERVQIVDRSTGPMLVVAGAPGPLQVWQIEPAELVYTARSSVIGAERPVDGTVAINGGFNDPLRIWDLAQIAPIWEQDYTIATRTDGASGRQLLSGPSLTQTVRHADGRGDVVLSTGKNFQNWEAAWGQKDLLAVHGPDAVDIYDTGSGERRARIEIETPGQRVGVQQMRFTPAEDRIVVLTTDSRLLVAETGSGEITSDWLLPGQGRQLQVSASGRFALIELRSGGVHVDLSSGVMTPVGQPADRIISMRAGPRAAVVSVFRGEDRAAWLMDMETGKKRFSLPWGDRYAVGPLDRLIVSDSSLGGHRIIDARTGDVLHHRRGDGGGIGNGAPRLSDDERWMISVNGGTDMIRLIDTETGQVRAALPRQDSFGGTYAPAHDFSAVTYQLSIYPSVIDLSDVMLEGEPLLAALGERYPSVPEAPTDGPQVSRCDRLAAFENDPMARADGVAFDALSLDALNTCWQELQALPPDSSTDYLTRAFQVARLMSRHMRDQDAETVKILDGLLEEGYPVAGYALAVLTIEGRAPGNRETVTQQLMEAGKAGAGIAWVTLSRLVAAGVLEGDAAAYLQKGVDAELPAALRERARQLATNDRDFRSAAELARKAAAAYADRNQTSAAHALVERAATYARRYRQGAKR